MGQLRLRTDVAIGPLKMDLAANMFSWMQDPDVSANIGLSHAPSLDKTLEWIGNALQENSIWPYAIFLNARHVGNVVLDQVDRYLDCARLSVYVGASEARGSGVGRTGMYYALRECFLERGLHKVWLTVHVRNAGAIRTYVALGFQVEGILRDGFLLNGERLPALYMGLLHQDFLKVEIG
jgi:RimJ/RimL family protein N-acetyltransferase